MYLSVLLLPFLSFLMTTLFGRFFGILGCRLISTILIFFCFLLSFFIFFETVITGSPCTLTLFPWFQNELLTVWWSFYFDTLTSVMFLVVSGVSSFVHLYSTEYLTNDPHQGRFMGYLSLFTGFMLVLVCADNFVVLFFAWEGIGLASFLLIGFWYNRIQANKSAVKAMLVNRIGDLGFALAICFIFVTFKSVDFFVVFSLVSNVVHSNFNFLLFNLDRLTVISFLLFWGALGKSAQIGLHIWLPDAMEGPTPVSALIHAATLVTAGVFLILRCSVFFENSFVLPFLVSFGSLTAFFASSIGLVQNDLKKVIAYSTCSQLGYMIFSAGLSHYSVAFFHLANHALFKALLFLSAGCVIHGVSDEQDMRKMGSFIQIFPVSYVMILIGSLALVGFPFLTGFFSKDTILEVALAKASFLGLVSHFLGCVAALCTSFYSFRLILLSFVVPTNSYKKYVENAHEASIVMIFPLLFLASGAIFWGFLSKDVIIGFGSSVFGNSLLYNVSFFNQIDAEFLAPYFKNLPLLCTIIGAFFSIVFIHPICFAKSSHFFQIFRLYFTKFYSFLIHKWYFDHVLHSFITLNLMKFGYSVSFSLFDKGILELFGPKGSSFQLLLFSRRVSLIQSGFVFNYALIIFVTLIILILFSLFSFSFATSFLSILFLSYLIFCFLLR